MFARIRAIAAGVGLCLLVAGCDQTITLYSVQDKPVPAVSRAAGTYQIEAHINQAASAKGWKVEKVRPGELRALQEWESYTIVATILFTQDAYSIRYHSSINMQERGGHIDRRYNARVQALETEIDRRLKTSSS